jgi:ABC-type arginine/histidine transport system permease subunit
LKALVNLVVLIRSGLSIWGLVRANRTGNHAVRMSMFYGMLAHVPHVRAYSSEFLYGVPRGCLGLESRNIESDYVSTGLSVGTLLEILTPS